MSTWIFDQLRWFFAEFGYGAVVIVLLLENAGLPVPGETTLLFASFLAFSEHKLHLPYIIALGIVACTVGDNLGYWIGSRGGRPFLGRYRHLFRLSDRTFVHGEQLFRRYGAATVFLARFIFGLRIIAGPMAGVLRMPWRRFLLFNFLGATVWVTLISLVGYFFGSQWDTLVQTLGRTNAIVGAAAVAVLYGIIRRYRRSQAASPENDRKQP